MANENDDPVLDEMRRKGSAGATAVAEPEDDDPVLQEMRAKGSAGAQPPQQTPTAIPLRVPSPQNYLTNKQYAPSTENDESGRPLLSYWDRVKKQWGSDKTRTAFTVDPTIAKPLDRSMLTNGRMPEAESNAIKQAMGGNYSEELDHKIALELGGSNDQSNLQLEPFIPGTRNTATDPLENQLARDVVGGKISWVDAQRKLAKAKGFSLPEDQAPSLWRRTTDLIHGNSEEPTATPLEQKEASDYALKQPIKPFYGTPSIQTPTEAAAKLSAPMLPMTPPVGAPHGVRGEFGQPIPPYPVEQKIRNQEYEETQGKQKQSDADIVEQNTPPETRFALQTVKNIGEALSKPWQRVPAAPPATGLQMPHPAEIFTNLWNGPGEARPALEEFANGKIDKAFLKSASDLLEPDNLALAAGMEVLPPSFALSAAGKVIMGTGFTVPMAVNLAHQVPPLRDAIKRNDWDTASQLLARALPTIAFTALGVKGIYDGITDGVNITKRFIADRTEAERQQTINAANYDQAQRERTPKLPLPSEESSAPQQAATPQAPTEPESPESPSVSEEAPEALVAQTAPEPETSDIAPSSEEAKPEELPLGPTAREIMARTPTASRAAPTGEVTPLPQELKSDLEKQAGRKLSDEEAIALDRSNTERLMATSGPGDPPTIREVKREELGRPRELPTTPPIQQAPPQPGKQVRQTKAHLAAAQDETRIRAGLQRTIADEQLPQDVRDLASRELIRHQSQPISAPSEPTVPSVTVTPPEAAAPAHVEKAEATPYQRQQAQLYTNRLRDPVEREYAQSYLRARRDGTTTPEPIASLTRSRAQQLAENVDEYLGKERPHAVAERFPSDVIQEAEGELRSAAELESSFDRPGRYRTEAEGASAYSPDYGGTWYGIKSARGKVAEQYPWYRDEGITPSRMRSALARRKGADYERIVGKIAEGIQAERESARPVIEEYAPVLRQTAERVREIDPELAERLTDIAEGRAGRGLKDLRDYIERELTDATATAEFSDAIDSAAREAQAEAGAPELAGQTRQPGGAEGILPGLEEEVAENRRASGLHQAGQLTEQINRPAESVESAAGEMEQKSPLFHGTAASPQREIEQRGPEVDRVRPSPLIKTSRLSAGFDPTVVKDLLASFAKDTTPSISDRTKGIVRERSGETERQNAIAQHMLESERNRVAKWTVKQSLDFIGRMESGRRQVTPEDNALADTLRAALENARHRVQLLGKGILSNFIENYFPHIWEDPNKANDAIARIMGKRTMQGPASFTKKRTIPTTDEGIKAGLKPVTYNPVELTLLKIREMNRYVMAHEILRDMTHQPGQLARFIFFGKEQPEGWVPLMDRVFTVYGPPTVPVTEYYDQAVWDKLSQLANNLGIEHERSTNIGGQRLGYTSQEGPVVTRFATPESVIAHEIGHQIDFKYGLKGKLVNTSPYREELRKLADLHWEGKKKEDVPVSYQRYVRKGEEKMATMVEALVHAPDKFKEVAPNTWAFLQDLIAKHPELKPLTEVKPSLRYREREDEVSAGGLVIRGRYYAPKDAADVIERFLSPGLTGHWQYDVLRKTGNLLNQAQLGMSAFYLMFTSMDATTSDLALALEKFTHGDLKGAAKFAARSASLFGSPIGTYLQGNRIFQEYMSPGKYAELSKLADAVARGGGRAQMDSFYKNDAVRSFWTAWKEGNWKNVGLRALPAALEKMASPIMEHIVPRMKLGVFANMAQDILDRLPEDASHDEINQALDKAWDSVDNRLGQLVYDNLFWHRTVKDVGMIGVRSLGWNLGTVRELGGGAKDFAQEAANAAAGKTPEMTHRMAYLIALPLAVAWAGAIATYLATGRGPKELKDYFYPPNGKSDAEGNAERWAIPSYVRDVVGFWHAPAQTALNKFHPIFEEIAEMIENKDFYGNKIRNEDDPLVKQVGNIAEYVAKSFIPFSARNAAQADAEQGKETGIRRYLPDTPDKAARFLGFVPAPKYIGHTPAENKLDDYLAQKAEQGGRTQQQAERLAEIRRLGAGLRSGAVTEDDVQKSATAGKITTSQAKELIENRNAPAMARVSQLSLQQALNVYDLATPPERKQIIPSLRSKIDTLNNLDSETKEGVQARLTKALTESGNKEYIPSTVDDETARLHYQGLHDIDSVAKAINYRGVKIPLGFNEQAEYQQMRGVLARRALQRMLSNPEYKTLSDEEKRTEIGAMIRDVDSYAREEMVKRLVDRRIKKLGPAELPMDAPLNP